jgi:hypothetical protein
MPVRPSTRHRAASFRSPMRLLGLLAASVTAAAGCASAAWRIPFLAYADQLTAQVESANSNATGTIRLEFKDRPSASVHVRQLSQRDADDKRAWILWLTTAGRRGYAVGPLNAYVIRRALVAKGVPLSKKAAMARTVAAEARAATITLAKPDKKTRRAVLQTRFGTAKHPFRVRGRGVVAGKFEM